jgi:hypothetical protein
MADTTAQEVTFSTREVAMMMGLKIPTLNKALYENRIKMPQKVGKAYRWTFDDIESASWTLRHRSADDILNGGSDG